MSIHSLYASGVELRGASALRVQEKYLAARDEVAAEFERRADAGVDYVPAEAERFWRDTFEKHGVGHLLRPAGKPAQDGLEDRMAAKAKLEGKITGERKLIENVSSDYPPPPNYDRQDLTAAAAVGFWKAFATFDDDGAASFPTYATICMKNAIADFIKYAKRRSRAFADETWSLDAPVRGSEPDDAISSYWDLIADRGAEVDGSMLWEERAQQVHAPLSSFEENVLRMYEDGYRISEIAKGLNRDKKAVENALDRIRKKIKVVLSEPETHSYLERGEAREAA